MSDENVPKALIEVWEWKRLASEELEKIPHGEQMAYIHERTKQMREYVNKKRAENKEKQQKP